MKSLSLDHKKIAAVPDETDYLQRVLNRSYARLRERARVEWEHYYAGSDPADACVSVHISDADCHSRVSRRAR